MINNTNNCACAQCERRDEQQKLSKYRQILDKLHDFDKQYAALTKEHKQQKIDYIKDLSNSALTNDVLHSSRYKYVVRYLDCDTVLITKHSMQDYQIVAYHVLTKDKFDRHINTQYTRCHQTVLDSAINCQALRNTKKSARDALLTLAKLDVCEYMTKEHY